MKLKEAIELASMWVHMWEDEQAEVVEVTDADKEERQIIKAFQLLLKAVPKESNYVAWMRWNGSTYVTCDSDEEGAFRVYKCPTIDKEKTDVPSNA